MSASQDADSCKTQQKITCRFYGKNTSISWCNGL